MDSALLLSDCLLADIHHKNKIKVLSAALKCIFTLALIPVLLAASSYCFKFADVKHGRSEKMSRKVKKVIPNYDSVFDIWPTESSRVSGWLSTTTS